MEKGKSSVNKIDVSAWLFISVVVIFFTVLIAFKGKLNSYVSESLQSMVLSSEK